MISDQKGQSPGSHCHLSVSKAPVAVNSIATLNTCNYTHKTQSPPDFLPPLLETSILLDWLFQILTDRAEFFVNLLKKVSNPSGIGSISLEATEIPSSLKAKELRKLAKGNCLSVFFT